MPRSSAGRVLAFAGAALLVTGGGASLPKAGSLPGLILAFLAALTWAGYSILSRRLGQVPTAAVVVFCLATSGLSVLAHLALESTLWPATSTGWLAVGLLGLGPVGLAFFFWDIGMKRGDVQFLGVASYAAPLLSTLILILSGKAAANATLGIGAALITGGALIAARASARGR